LLFVAPAWRADRRRITGAAFAAIPPLSLYAFLPLRSLGGAAYRWGSGYTLSAERRPLDLSDPQLFWGYVTAKVFRPLTQIYGWPDRVHEALIFAGDFWAALLGGGVFVLAVGAVWLFMRQRRIALLFALVAVPNTLFFINYAAPDKDTMFLTAYVVAAILIGCGVAWLLAIVAPTRATFSRRPVAFALVGIWAVLLVQTNFSLVDVSQDRRAPQESAALFNTADDHAVIIGRWTDIAPLEYLQIVDHQRPDVALVHEWALSDQGMINVARYNVRSGRAVYVFREEPLLEDRFDFVPVGDWYRLREANRKVREVQ
jgi:hypothetical protein